MQNMMQLNTCRHANIPGDRTQMNKQQNRARRFVSEMIRDTNILLRRIILVQVWTIIYLLFALLIC